MADTEEIKADADEATSPETDNATDDATTPDVDGPGSGDASEIKAQITNQLLMNPLALAAVQEKLGSIVGSSSGYIESLPASVKRRIKALKKLQAETLKIEGSFYEEVHQLECKYAEKYSSFYEKRRDVVSGAVEPTDSDCDWPSDEEDEDDEGEVKAKVTIKDENDTEKKDETEPEVSGVPSFWLTTFKNVDILSDMIQEHDEPILNHLKDIKVNLFQTDTIGFILEFVFSDCEYFTNTVLSKKYILRADPDPADLLAYEGPEIIRCEGCKIDWKSGKDVTTKTIKKKQKHKGRGTTRTINKTVQVDSFFNFFNPPKINEGSEAEVDEETEALLAADFEIGHLMRERIVPRAVLYFTGEALDDDDYDEEGDEEEGGDEEDDENDPDFDVDKAKQNEQCKQQ